ncbi:DUF1684 domain-containing protein [Rufibacter quisquiliarum]|uniref:DUF1684 domain-containing protein n=1 Tax=Rufibacter quisquiliarum TaxID=1549639 RepID=A0A839GE20_9BACT|nr:DUF1684 domain-containing protein [Rufibacter quisquiliarum]MBA9076680.1 hypothetical protein [Rufibacter quisquiliarum]
MKGFKYIIILGVLLIIGYWVSDLFYNDESYSQAVLKYRENKDLNFRSVTNSPLPDSVRRRFDKLTYYAPTRDYEITADFMAEERPEPVAMPMTTGTQEPYYVKGKAEFELDGQTHTLTLFQKAGSTADTLFIPFTDQTNGFETYGGGRYLDAIPNGKTIVLDFNKAYNPFCAYNPEFACPMPPAENRLKVKIPAGEKEFALK